MSGPPAALVRALVEGPSLVSAVDWHDEVTSTQLVAAQAARSGAREIHVVLADVQTAGRGRHQRTWQAPAGTSLMGSYLLRPQAGGEVRPLLSLLAGLALVQVVERYCPDAALKWPNDLLLGGCKAAGVLAEGVADAVVIGMGVNVDWRGVDRPEQLAGATSMAEAAGADVDRWRVLAAFAGVFTRRYLDWQDDPTGFLDDYRRRCATLGQTVTVTTSQGQPLVGQAVAVGDDGTLHVRDDAGVVRRVSAGDVEHVRLG